MKFLRYLQVFNILNNFKNLVFFKFASNQSQIYQFINRQDFLYLYSVKIHTPHLVILDHFKSRWVC